MPLDERPVKKINVRKGTFSCWECKRRKKKCIISTDGQPEACNLCHRMGYRCISQQYVQNDSRDTELLTRRIEYVENLAALLASSDRRPSRRPLQLCPTQPIHPLTGAGEDYISRCRSLSGLFYSTLPHPFVAGLILKHGKAAYQGVREPLKLSKSSSNDLDERPIPADALLACLARKLIRLAVSLMYIDSTSPEHARDLQLTASATETARQYVSAAQQLTSRKELLLSSAGLEAVMMEGHYCVHLGQIEQGSVSFRRAMHLARAIGLPEKAATNDDVGLAARVAYSRLAGVNRSLSLYSGEPCEDINDSILRPQPESREAQPCERLSQLHIQLWRRIIARNIRIQHAWKCGWDREAVLNDELLETLHIDREMKQATLFVPASWWHPCSAYPTDSDVLTEESFTRLNTSKDHFNTIVLTHLPYVLHASTTNSSTCFIYSKSAAVSASREVLLRFPTYQQFKHVPASYRAVEQKAFVASVVLLLAHMHSHQSAAFDAIGHERPKDLNVLLAAVTSMEEIFSKDRHYPYSKYAPMLRRMMEIEEQMAIGLPYNITCSYDLPAISDASGCVGLQLPYFGHVLIEQKDSMQTGQHSLENTPLDGAELLDHLDEELLGLDPPSAGDSPSRVLSWGRSDQQGGTMSLSSWIPIDTTR